MICPRWTKVHLEGCIPGGKYTWRDVHLKGCAPGGTYTWWDVHLEGCAPGGIYTWKDVHLVGSIHSPHLPALFPILLSSQLPKATRGFITHVITYILWEDSGVPRSYSIPILST